MIQVDTSIEVIAYQYFNKNEQESLAKINSGCATMPELALKNISKRFGGLLAVDNLDLEVPEGSILSLIGPNGAGKTTVFNMITGVYPPSKGTIIYRGSKLSHLRSNRIIRRGIARTFQNIRLFKSMTVLENVQVGMHCRTKSAPDSHLPWNLEG